MVVLCANCGYPNKLKKISFKNSLQRISCKKCGYETVLETGTMGVSHKAGAVAEAAPKREEPSSLFPPPEPSLEGYIPEEADEKVGGPPIPKTFRYVAVLLVMMVIPVVVASFGHFYTRIKTADAVNAARAFVAENSAIENMTGKLITMEASRVQLAKDAGGNEHARIEMGMRGTEGSITAVIYLRRSGGAWSVTDARYLDVSGGERRLPSP